MSAKSRSTKAPETHLLFGRVKSPIGTILLACAGDKLCALEFADSEDRMLAVLRRRYGKFKVVDAADPGRVCTRIGAYLLGDLGALDDIVVDGGGTPFQRKVWAGLRKVAAGRTVSSESTLKKAGALCARRSNSRPPKPMPSTPHALAVAI